MRTGAPALSRRVVAPGLAANGHGVGQKAAQTRPSPESLMHVQEADVPGVAYAEAEPAGPETTRSPRSPAKTPPEQRLASSGARRGEASPASPHPRPAVVRALPRTLQTKGMALMAHRRGPAGPDSEGGQPAGCRSLDPSAPGGGTGGGVGAPASAANNLKLPAKVLKKLGNLSSWQPAGGRHGSGSKSSQWSSHHATRTQSESTDPPSPFAARGPRLSSEVFRPRTASRLSLDLPGAARAAQSSKRSQPDCGREVDREIQQLLKKSTSTESLGSLYNTFASILADPPKSDASRLQTRAPGPLRSTAGDARRRPMAACSGGKDEGTKEAALPWDSDEACSARSDQGSTTSSRTNCNGGEDTTTSSPKQGSYDNPRHESTLVRSLSETREMALAASPSTSNHPGISALSRHGSLMTNEAMSKLRSSEELFYRLSRARQTMDFVRRQYQRFGTLDRAELYVFEALGKLGTVPEFEAELLGDDGVSMSLLEHAFQTAEKLRAAYPQEDWLHLSGLIHGLGKLLAHEDFGPEPQWAIVGESFPVGCRFSEAIRHHQLFYPNPDRRNRQHNSVNGIYAPGCGLHEVNFSWSGAEYLYLVLFLNNTLLPPEALFCIRYQKFDCLFEGAYRHLLSEEDTLWVKWLQALREAAVFIPDEAIMQRIRDQDDRRKMCDYYQGLIEKYIGNRPLCW